MDDGTLARALLQYRNTPSRKDRLSPAQKLFGRPVQDTLPAHHRAFAPEWQRSAAEAEEHEQSYREEVEYYYDRTAHRFRGGSNVAVQDSSTKRWDIYGVVTDIGPHRRYSIKTSSGHVLVRNRRFLRRRIPILPPTQSSDANVPPQPHQPPNSPQPPPVRRSTRTRVRPQRLIEEITF